MILCAGEALIDMLPRQTAEGSDAFLPCAGGAVFNTAIALGRLGVPTGFLSGISRDMFGETLEQSLTASQVDISHAIRSDRPTTMAFVKLRDGHATYVFYDENSAGRQLDPADLPDIPDTVRAMYFGSISLVAEPCGAFYEALMLRETANRVVMVDPNIRPGFVTDEPAYRARLTRMFSAADIVKLSDEDLAWIMGDGPPETLAEQLLDLGPKLVFVTQGAKGALAMSRKARVIVPAEPAKVVDTVGAGDTFNAGILAALDQAGALASKDRLLDLDADMLERAARMGARCAAITVSRAGANPPWAAEL